MKCLSCLLLGLLVITSSCQKDFLFAKKTQHGIIPAEYFSLWTEAEEDALDLSLPIDGYIIIANQVIHHNQTSIPGETMQIGGHIQNSSGIASDFGTFSINSTNSITPTQWNGLFGYELLPGTVDLSYLFGNTNYYSLSGNTSSGYPGFTNASLYFPKALIISSPSYIHGGIDTIKVNDFITWNEDTNDAIGLKITLTYEPIENVANGLVSSHPNPIIKRYYVPDNGSFQLTSAVLAPFPDGSKLWVDLSRGTYKRVEASGISTYHIGIINYTMISTFIQIEKG